MKTILLVYAIILIIELLYTHYYLNNWKQYESHELSEQINFNLSNSVELEKLFSKTINERINMLETMDYLDWMKYNNENMYITFKKHKYYLFGWERTKIDEDSRLDNSSFIYRCTPVTKYRDLPVEIVLNEINYHFLYGIYKPDPNMINNMWDLSGLFDKNTNRMMIYWINMKNDKPIKKNVIFNKYKKYIKNEEAIAYEGVLGIGYPVLDLELEYSNNYYSYLNFNFFIGFSISSLIVSLLLYYGTDKKSGVLKPVLFMIFVNIYLMNFLNLRAGLTSEESENSKLVDINSGITAISFLVAVNIFIIKTLSDTKNQIYGFLYTESAFLFCISLILLLFASSKNTDFNTITDLRIQNIRSQFFFNMSIIINLIIFFNYLLYVATKSKLLKKIFTF